MLNSFTATRRDVAEVRSSVDEVWALLVQTEVLVRHTPFLAIYGQASREGSMVTVISKRFKALGELEATPDEHGEPIVALTHRSHDFH